MKKLLWGARAADEAAVPPPWGALLEGCILCRGLNPQELGLVARAARARNSAAGEVVCREGDSGLSMYLVVRGRLRVSLRGGAGAERTLGYLGQGDHFGEMALLIGGSRLATVTSVTEAELLEISWEAFQQLLESVPGFAANLSRSLGLRLHAANSGRRRAAPAAGVGIVHGGVWGRELVAALAGVPAVKRLERNRLHQDGQRVLTGIDQRVPVAELAQLLAPLEVVWWLVEPETREESLLRLQELAALRPELPSQLHRVWLLDAASPVAPAGFAAPAGSGSDLKVVWDGEPCGSGRLAQMGIERLVRRLRGFRIGLALGGGGARGLAHLGVLQALEDAGLAPDLIAGTSSGAMIGLTYAAGMSPRTAAAHFKCELTPPQPLRALPGAPSWYLWWMFRTGAWDRKLRRHFSDYTFEQLQLPLSTVAVDLISGRQVVRESGDCVNAVVESINVPRVSAPIQREGMVLVDGGVLNNLPGDVLAEKGADLVVAVDVAARMAPTIGKPGRGGARPAKRRLRTMETLVRVFEVQARGMTELRTGSIDLCITPETAAFDFADFSRVDELFAAGLTAGSEAIPHLRQMLAELAGPEAEGKSCGLPEAPGRGLR